MTEDAQQTVAEWVDGGVIANQLAENLKERGMRVNVKNMKALWLAALEELANTIDGVPDDRVRREARELKPAPKTTCVAVIDANGSGAIYEVVSDKNIKEMSVDEIKNGRHVHNFSLARATDHYLDEHPQAKQKYVCPDCGWTLETRAHHIRCGGCGSLNLERELSDGRYIKADADETAPENAHLIHARSTDLDGGTAQ